MLLNAITQKTKSQFKISMKLLLDNFDEKQFNFYPIIEIRSTFSKEIHIVEIKIISVNSEKKTHNINESDVDLQFLVD